MEISAELMGLACSFLILNKVLPACLPAWYGLSVLVKGNRNVVERICSILLGSDYKEIYTNNNIAFLS
jgi:hypothetical protein